MQRPIKRVESQSTSDDSGSASKKLKPLHEKKFRPSITQELHTSILRAINAGSSEGKWKKYFVEFKALLNCALITPNQVQYVTALSKNNISLLIDILHLPYGRCDGSPQHYFSHLCETRVQADERCQLLLAFMLEETIKNPAVFSQLIFTGCMGKSTLHNAIKTGSLKVVETYLKYITEAIKGRVISSEDVLNKLILACDDNGRNIFHYANKGNHVEIMAVLVNFIRENYSDKHCAINILDNLFSPVRPQSQQVDSIKNECLSQTTAAKVAVQEWEAARLRQVLEEERARSASMAAENAFLSQQVQEVSKLYQDTYLRLNFELANLQNARAFSIKTQGEAETLRSDVAALRQELAEERRQIKIAEDHKLIAQGTYWQLHQQLNNELTEKGRLQAHLLSSQREIDQASIAMRDQVRQVETLEHEVKELRARLSAAERTLEETQSRRDRYEDRPRHYGRLHAKPQEKKGLYPAYVDSPSPKRRDL